jgi:uncharacterized protein
MKKVIILIMMMVLLTTFARAQKNFIDENYIEVTGKAEKEIVPDQIFLQIFINEGDYKGKESLEMLEKKMIETLTIIGVDMKKEFAVKDISSNFKNYWLKKSDIFTSKEYQVIVHTAPIAGRVFRELEAIGISNISIEKLDNSEIDKYKMEIKANAVKNAKETASLLAEAAGLEIGNAIYIHENEPFFYQPMMAQGVALKVRGYATDQNYTEPEMEFEKIKLEYSVLVSFKLNTPAPKVEK